jgi:hypothetical protein
MKSMRSWMIALLAALAFHTTAHATLIDFTAQSVGGNTWRYDYSVTNDTLTDPLEEFTIFFDRNFYSNLQVAASPSGWDSLVVQPDLNIPDHGFFDSLSLMGGLLPGQTASGFSVLFDWTGTSEPGGQSFSVVDPESFEPIDGGTTRRPNAPPPVSVPEPGTLILFALGLLALLGRPRRGDLRRAISFG